MDKIATDRYVTGSEPIALWVVPVGDFGGVARHVLDAATTGIPGWRIVVLAPPGAFIDACHVAGVPTIAAAFGPEHGLLRSVATLRRATSRLRPTVVHTHLAYADIAAGIAFATRRGPKLVSTEHGISGDPSLYQRSGLHSVLMTRAHSLRLRSFAGVIAVSHSTSEQIRKRWRPPGRLPIEVIPNGVNPEPRESSELRPGLRIATLSRLSHEKRLKSTLEAFAELHRREPTATLTVAGEGPDRAALVDVCTDLGINEAVEFSGFVDSRELLRRTDVIVQLSAWENCSYTLLDALAAGVGVVATPVGGNPEMLGSSGLVASDDPRIIADALLAQAREPILRPTLPSDWPSRAQMTAAIAGFYERVER
ncbi:MAG: glycosyltransferase [Actinobacteria bacterium]|uniref:Unannotated protein n=1 Tax=freshwater metagenome TaxID=449393 RepID=A0A6J5YA91_9ZZZZ|nr:glycosyltransferase [Actinomycetota bacterium]